VFDVRPPPEDGELVRLCAGLPRPRGRVVHVGAHAGEELETYVAAGFDGIALIVIASASSSRVKRGFR
jgi:hypothetical protein